MFAAEVHRPPAAGAWTTLACRDRNRVVLEQELAGLAAVGVDGVLCVTGDGRGRERAAGRHPGVRPRRHPAGRAGRRGWGCRSPCPSRRRPRRSPLRPGPGRREAAGRRAAVRAQPRGSAGAGGRVRRRRPGRRGDAAVRRRRSPSTPTSARRGCCSASPACTWTTRSSSGCWPRPDPRDGRHRRRGRGGAGAAGVPGVVGVNLSGAGVGARREDDGAAVKAEVADAAPRRSR